MTRGRTSKFPKKSAKNPLGQITEPGEIQKRNKDKYDKNKVRNDARKAAARAIVLDEIAQKKAIEDGKGALFDGMTMEQFLRSDLGDSQVSQIQEEESHKPMQGQLLDGNSSFYEFMKHIDQDFLELDPDGLECVNDEDKMGGLRFELNMDILSIWEKQLVEEKSLQTTKQILVALKNRIVQATGQPSYGAPDLSLFDHLLQIAFQNTPEVVQYHLPLVKKDGKLQASPQEAKLAQIIPILKSFFRSTLLLLRNPPSPNTTLIILSQTEKLIPYITGFRKLMKQLISSILDIWSQTDDFGPDGETSKPNSEMQKHIKMAAFLWVKRVMLTSHAAFVRSAAITTSRTLPHLSFLKTTLSELFGVSQHTSYPVAFASIRQLAIHLRRNLHTKTPDTIRIVYCWQYIHSLDFFSGMIIQHVGKNKAVPFYPLVHSIIEIILQTIKLNPSTQYLPLRFHLVKTLLEISRQTDVYVPLAPILLEPLNLSLLKTSPSKKSHSASDPVDLETSLRIPSIYLSDRPSRAYRDQVLKKLVQLLAQFFGLHASKPAFPELALPHVTVIKQWLKEHGAGYGANVRQTLSDLCAEIEEQAKWVEELRQGMEFSSENPGKADELIEGVESGPLHRWIEKEHLDM